MNLLKNEELYYFYVPAYKPSYIENAFESSIKNLILCLEDGTPSEKKLEARVLTKFALKEYSASEKNIIVRINGVETELWQEDILALINSRALARIRIPMLKSAKDFLKILKFIEKNCLTPPKIKYEIMIENLDSLHEIERIFSSSPDIYCFTLGGEDLLNDIKSKFVTGFDQKQIYENAKRELSEFCNMVNVPCFDTTFMDYKNQIGFINDCKKSKELKYHGRSIIHPDQIDGVIKIYGC